MRTKGTLVKTNVARVIWKKLFVIHIYYPLIAWHLLGWRVKEKSGSERIRPRKSCTLRWLECLLQRIYKRTLGFCMISDGIFAIQNC